MKQTFKTSCFKMSKTNSFSFAGFFLFFKSFSLSKVLLDKSLIFGSKYSNEGNHIFVSF